MACILSPKQSAMCLTLLEVCDDEDLVGRLNSLTVHEVSDADVDALRQLLQKGAGEKRPHVIHERS